MSTATTPTPTLSVGQTLLTQAVALLQPAVNAALAIEANPTTEVAGQQLGALIGTAAPTVVEDGIATGAKLFLALYNLVQAHLASTPAPVAAATPVTTSAAQ